ncbi:MAG: hypothetical protein HXY20_02455 [Acidobacteria bacterium]|nr:hypothetical protein [Acidobacteriota bacterium]
MPEKDVIRALTRKGANVARIAEMVAHKPQSLPQILEGLHSKDPRVKYGCAKLLRILSEKRPELLYPMFDSFVGLLDGKNKILQWDAAFILAELAGVDTERRLQSIVDRYLASISGPVMITAANVIRGGATIARAQPWLTERITREILKVERAEYQTEECRNVALGHAIESLDRFFDQIESKGPVLELVRRQLRNTRSATREKAERFLQRHAASGADLQ